MFLASHPMVSSGIWSGVDSSQARSHTFMLILWLFKKPGWLKFNSFMSLWGVEKLLFQSFPLDRIDLSCLTRRDTWLTVALWETRIRFPNVPRHLDLDWNVKHTECQEGLYIPTFWEEEKWKTKHSCHPWHTGTQRPNLTLTPRNFLAQTKELEDIAGNAMNVRAAAAAWICAFKVVNLPEWASLAARRTNWLW